MERVYANTEQPPVLENWFFGNAQSLCLAIRFPDSGVPDYLDHLAFLGQRQAFSNPEQETGVGPVRCRLGSSWFGEELGSGYLRPDQLEAGVAGVLTLPVRRPLRGLNEGVLYVTLEAPPFPFLWTGHVGQYDTVFTELRVRDSAGERAGSRPLWCRLVGRKTMRMREGVTALEQVDHRWFTQAIREGGLRKRTRITLWSTDLTLNAPPFGAADQLPQVTDPYELRSVRDYSVERSDQFQSGELTLTLSSEEYRVERRRFQENAMLTVDEEWKRSDQSLGWVRRGTFFLDSGTGDVSAEGDEVTLVARDVFKLVMLSDIETRLWPDKIFMPRRRLRKIRDGFRDRLPYHVFVDGTEAHKTVLWSPEPKVKLWRGNRNRDGERIFPSRGSVDILHRTGEVLIEREYFRANQKYGGLGNPEWLDAEYHRLALPEDEVPAVTVAGVREDATGSHLTLRNLEPLQQWRGGTVEVLTGSAHGQVYRVTGVTEGNPGSLRFMNRYLASDGVRPGDEVRILFANRVEDAIRRVLLLSGFQDVDPDAPFYIESLLPPATGMPICLPPEDAFDYRYQNSRSAFSVLQQIGFWLPPNVRYVANSLGNVSTTVYDPEHAPRYEWESVTENRSERNDQEVYTRVVYRVRDLHRPNLVGFTGGKLRSVTVHNPVVAGRRTLLNLARIYPNEHLRHLKDKGERIRRVVSDGREKTGVTWQLKVSKKEAKADDPPPNGVRGRLDGQVLLTWELDDEYRIAEIHVRAPSEEWVRGQYLEFETSLDGLWWETATDEFNFGGKDDPYRVIELERPLTARFLRVRCTHAARTDQVKKEMRGLKVSNVKEFSDRVGIGDVAVYADDVVEAVVELGVNRLSDGKTEGVPSDEVAWRQRLGRRTRVIEPIDERGYEISQAMGFSRLREYAEARALEFLNEYVQDFVSYELAGVRPDLNVGDLVRVGDDAQGSEPKWLTVRRVKQNSDDTVQATLTDYRYQPEWTPGEDRHPVSGDWEEPETQELTDDALDRDDWAGDLTPEEWDE